MAVLVFREQGFGLGYLVPGRPKEERAISCVKIDDLPSLDDLSDAEPKRIVGVPKSGEA